MIPAGFVRRLAALEAMFQAKEAPAGEGLAALLAWIRKNPSPAEADDVPPGRLTGLQLVVEEAREFLKKDHDHG